MINSIEIEAGKYWDILPSAPLRTYIKKYYFTEGFTAFSLINIHPIGKENIEMHFHYGNAGFDVFDFDEDDFVERRAYVVGNQPFDTLYKTRIIEKMAMLSVEFTHLGVISLLHCYPADLQEKILDLEIAFGSKYKALSNEVTEMSSNMDRVSKLERFFTKELTPNTGLQKREKDILSYLDTHEASTVDEMCQDLKISLRTLERVFTNRLGMSPKEYIRIARFNKACELLSHYPENTISDIINDCNYYDQSHFIHEFRHLVRQSPLQYLKKVNGLFYFGRGYVL